jgi:alpha-glucosidase
MQAVAQSTSETPADTLFIHFFRGREKSEYIYYEDDGSTLENENGKFLTRLFTFNPQTRQISIGAPEGSFTSKYKKVTLVLHGFTGMKDFRVNGTANSFAETSIDLLTSIPDKDPNYVYARKFPQDVLQVTFNNDNSRTLIEW